LASATRPLLTSASASARSGEAAFAACLGALRFEAGCCPACAVAQKKITDTARIFRIAALARSLCNAVSKAITGSSSIRALIILESLI
jgi:hypothetical protein